MTDEQFHALIETLRQDNAAMREENAAAHAETRRHFDVALDGAKQETRHVVEAVVQTREVLSREVVDVREEVRRTASETQAMIKFSHAELDRRVRTPWKTP